MSPLPEICFALCRNPAVAVGLPLGLGLISGWASTELQSRRTGLPKSQTSPAQAQAFSPIWTAMYGLMGYASHLIVRAFDAGATPQATKDASDCMGLYWAQLGLNLLWAPLFVGQDQPNAAMVNLTALTGTVITLAVKANDLTFAPINPAFFLAPYAAWLGYTTYVNGRTVWFENK